MAIVHVYAVIKKSSARVMYVGVTKRAISTRWNEHSSAARRGLGSRLHDAIRKHGESAFQIAHIADCFDEEEARVVERKLISEFKTFERGGYNATPGGDGHGRNPVVLSADKRAETSARNVDLWADPEWRAKQCAAMKGRKKPEGFGAAVSARRLGVALPEQTKANMSASRAGKKHSPETRAKIAAKNSERNKSPEQRKAISAAWALRRKIASATQQE
jgi:group I intron endonuclease